MRTIYFLVIFILLFGAMACPAYAKDRNSGMGVSFGYSIAAANDAVEDFAIGAKYRLSDWEGAFEIFRSKFENGGYDKMGVASIDYTWDFQRLPGEDFGIYIGAGLSYLGAADVWGDGVAWNILVGYDYTNRVSLAGRFFNTLDGEMFATGGITYLLF
jgi:hypothetical protein